MCLGTHFLTEMRAKAHVREFFQVFHRARCVFHRALLRILQGSFAYTTGICARRHVSESSCAYFTGLFCLFYRAPLRILQGTFACIMGPEIDILVEMRAKVYSWAPLRVLQGSFAYFACLFFMLC